MIKVTVLGTGNVATHFIKAFKENSNIEIVQIFNHNADSLKKYAEFDTTDQIQNLKPADVYLVCIKDDHVTNLIHKITQPQSIVAHTSGSIPLLDSGNRNAVFYPLQTFSKDKKISFQDMPICIETEHKSDYEVLKILGESLGAKIYAVDSSQRQELHLAAVFVCNFVNHLYHIGHEICFNKDLPFDILKPLIQETAEKINHNLPKSVQTGPAKRNDKTTINRHIHQLDNPNYQEIYRYLTSSIQKTYE